MKNRWVIATTVIAMVSIFIAMYAFAAGQFVSRTEYENTLQSIDNRLGRIEGVLMRGK